MLEPSLSLHALPGLPLVGPGDDLAALIADAAQRIGLLLRDGDVLVVAQKIVSKSEGRLIELVDVEPSAQARQLAAISKKDARLVELILRESNEVMRCQRDVIIVEHRLGFVMANAGIDQSNVEQGGGDGNALLLPLDPDGSCERLRCRLRELTGAELGVVINDSHGRAWRNGAVGVAIGAAGVAALWDLRGTPDLFGRKLQVSEVGHADEIAAAASLLMGQAAEGSPVVLLRGLRTPRREGKACELVRPREQDLFR